MLNAAYAKGDSEKAFDLLVLLEESEEGIIKDYDPSVKLLGAINREGVSCYLDSVLFAMFARLGSFEAILFNNFEDPPRKRLATLLRLWVNTLRVGKLITTDIVGRKGQSRHYCADPRVRQSNYKNVYPTVDGRRLRHCPNRMHQKHSPSSRKPLHCHY